MIRILLPEELVRAHAVLLGSAAGDALGAGYEFGPSLPATAPVDMIGGGPFGFAPGEWTDDTSMAIAIAEQLALGGDPRDEAVQDRIVARWREWAATSKDVGNQVRWVLANSDDSAASARAAAAMYTDLNERAAGNGSLMRTAPLALAFLDDPVGLAAAARAISELTHPDPDAVESCIIWCELIRLAATRGTLAVGFATRHVPADRAAIWEERMKEAELHPPERFPNNGWVVHAIQAAWSSIHATGVATWPREDGRFVATLRRAVRAGNDTDTVAAITGAVAGPASWETIPTEWRDALHGWPGLDASDLENLAEAIVYRGATDAEVAQARAEQYQECPICHRVVQQSPRYPNYVCSECMKQSTTLDGRAVAVNNVSISGFGVQFFLLDENDENTGEVIGERDVRALGSPNCLVRAVPCYAAEAHMGGIVILPA